MATNNDNLSKLYEMSKSFHPDTSATWPVTSPNGSTTSGTTNTYTPQQLLEKNKKFHQDTSNIWTTTSSNGSVISPSSSTVTSTSTTTDGVSPNFNPALNRKAEKLKLMAKGMSRRDAKNQATLLTIREIEAIGDKATPELQAWANARRKLYTYDSKSGTLTRNKSNFWNIFGTIMGGLTLGPTGAVIANSTIPRHLKAAPTTNWGTSTLDSIKPSQEFLDAEARIKLAVNQEKPAVQTNPTTPTISNSTTPTVNNSAGTPAAAVLQPVAWEDTDFGQAAIKYKLYSPEAVKEMLAFLKSKKFLQEDTGNWDDASTKAYKAAKDAGYVRTGNIFAPHWTSILPKEGVLNGDTYTINNFNGNKGQTMTFTFDPTTKKISYTRDLGNGTSLKGNWINGKYQRGTRGVKIIGTNDKINFNNGVGTYKGNLVRISPSGKLQMKHMGTWRDFINKYEYFKKGGKFQQGGSMTQEDLQEQLLTAATLGMIGYANANQKAIDFTTAVSQIMELALTKPETLQEIASNEELVKAGIEIMKQLEPEVLEMVSKPGGLRKILAQLKNKTKMAKQGSKLEYIQKLRGICPEGYEMSYMKAGGKVCPVCKKKSKKAQNGTKMLDNGMPVKKMGGAISDLMNEIKTSLFQNGGKTTQKVNWTDPVDDSQFAFNDSTELKEYQNLIRQFRKDKTKMSKLQLDRLSELNKRMISSTNKD